MLDPSTRNLITYNGEIYNYRELRQELGDPPTGWKSNTDTEVILRAYAQWGNACVRHFRGMFAFAIWDPQRKRLFLARDRLGIKPLYYYNRDGSFLFSSEVRSLPFKRGNPAGLGSSSLAGLPGVPVGTGTTNNDSEYPSSATRDLDRG